MNSLVQRIKRLRKASIAEKVSQSLLEFGSFKGRGSRQWFSELCFCLLTANSRAETALKVQQTLGAEGFCKATEAKVRKCIKDAGHRFHNNKARFIVEARKHFDVKQVVTKLVEKEGEKATREWLVKNVKGLGYKEASHFLRNVGYRNLAILDRHILNLLLHNGFVKEKPESLSKKKYLEIEKKFQAIAKQLKMPAAELDLFMWYLKTGKVLK